MKRDFLTLADQGPEALGGLLALARTLKAEHAAGGNPPLLAGRTLGMIFQKPSLRTRVSFEMAMRHLGGHALYLSPDEVRLGERESVPDVARVLSRFVDAVMARVFAHDHIVRLAQWASVPVINGLSDHNHPCQGLADLLTIQEKLGGLAGVQLAYVGDGNNVLTSLLFGAALTGMAFTAATPPEYAPSRDIVAQAEALARQTNARLRVVTDPAEAIAGAQVVYTDTWTSMGQETEAVVRRQAFSGFQVNEALLAGADAGVGVMHCLPAHRGEEITDAVADGPHSWLFDQAENRLHAQKAVLVDLLTR